jgi:cold shock CspA family protein
VRGKDHGYIRSDDGRDVFFDRRSLSEGSFNDLEVGDRIAFELIEDRLSGPRGLHVRKMTA